MTVHWKWKRSFSYETENVRQMRITSQQACFPAKSSCTYLGNLLVYFPVLHNKRKLIIFPTDLRKSHHNNNNNKKIQCSKDHIQMSHFKVFLHRNIFILSSLLKPLMTIPQKANWPDLYFCLYIRFEIEPFPDNAL